MEYSDKPPFEGHIRYCVRCCMPETERGTSLDELGICRACRSSEEKMHIDWDERELALRALLDEATERAKGNYDCMIPISGGKDSTFQLYVLTQLYGVKPLAVTFNQNWQSESGWYNLMNCLEQFDVDLLMFTPSRKLVNRVAKRSIEMIGDGCWHCHAGLSAFPLHIAIKYDVPLIIKGEPPSEQGLSSYCKPLKVDYSFHFKTSTLKQAHEMECDYLSSKDLFPLVFPSEGEYVEAGVTHIKLGSYIILGRRAPDRIRARQFRLARDRDGALLQALQVRGVRDAWHPRLHLLPQAGLRSGHLPGLRRRAQRPDDPLRGLQDGQQVRLPPPRGAGLLP